MLWFNRHSRHRNNLSAYVDEQLSTPETRALETHLEACDHCRLELAGLRTLAAAFRDLPQAHVPRSLTLSPDQVAEPAMSKQMRPASLQRWRLAGAAMAAALALVLVIDASDVSIRGGSNGANEAASRQNLAAQGGAATEMAKAGAYDTNVGAVEASAAGENISSAEN